MKQKLMVCLIRLSPLTVRSGKESTVLLTLFLCLELRSTQQEAVSELVGVKSG